MIYAEEISTKDKSFNGRKITIGSGDGITEIPVPDELVICNGCGKNIYPEKGYLVYLSKQDLKNDLPYDFYCKECLHKSFPKAKIIKGE